MNPLLKTFTSTLIAASILTACGGGGSSSPNTGSGGGTTTPPAIESVDISGQAIKGVIKNGVVRIFGITNGVTDETPLVEGTTDENGEYSLTVESYTGPVVVEITASETSVMVCDVLAGCDGVAFGEDLVLTDDFSLKAVVSEVEDGEDVTTNVTALTSLAASLAESNGTLDASAVAEANAQVAALFNITGSLTELEVVDITDTDSVNTASSEAQEAAILNAALLSAALGDATEGTSVGDALAAVATDFASNDGQLTNNESTDSETVSLAEIFIEVLAIVEDSSFTDVNLGTLESTTELLLAQAEAAEPDSSTSVEPAQPADQDSAQAAKNMVEAVRAFGLAATYQGSDEVAFVDSIELATDLINEDDIDTIFEGLEPISNALVLAHEANTEAINSGLSPLTIFTVIDAESQFEIPVTITSAETGYTYSIDTTMPSTVTGVSELDVDVSAVISVDIVETFEQHLYDPNGSEQYTYGEREEFEGVASLAVSGTVNTDDILMTINSGNIEVELNDVYDWLNIYIDEHADVYNHIETTFVDDVELALASIDLNITIEQLQVEAPISFTGILDISIDDASFLKTHSQVQGEELNCDITEGPDGTQLCLDLFGTISSSYTFEEIDFLLSGEFSQGNDSVIASITFNIDPDSTIHQYAENLMFEFVGFRGDTRDFLDTTLDEVETVDITGETEENFIGVDFGIALEFDLASNTDVTGVMFTATRTGLEASMLSLDIMVGSDRLDVDVEIQNDDVDMTITDQNSNTLNLSEVCNVETDECIVSGNIMIDGEQVATINEDTDNDVFVITYQDGSFEVL